MYKVAWHDRALEDLQLKAPKAVARELVALASVVLQHHHPPDGGHPAPYYWRRALTPQRRDELDAVASTGQYGEPQGPNTWDYIFVYKNRPFVGGYLIIGVYANGELIAALTSLGAMVGSA